MVEERILEAAYLDDFSEVERLLNEMTVRELAKLERIAQEIADRAATTADIKRKGIRR